MTPSLVVSTMSSLNFCFVRGWNSRLNARYSNHVLSVENIVRVFREADTKTERLVIDIQVCIHYYHSTDGNSSHHNHIKVRRIWQYKIGVSRILTGKLALTSSYILQLCIYICDT